MDCSWKADVAVRYNLKIKYFSIFKNEPIDPSCLCLTI